MRWGWPYIMNVADRGLQKTDRVKGCLIKETVLVVSLEMDSSNADQTVLEDAVRLSVCPI